MRAVDNTARNARIVELRRAGRQYDWIAAHLGVTRNVVASVIRRCDMIGQVERRAPHAAMVARMAMAAMRTRDRLLEIADGQRFDDEVFHAAQQAACGWQMFAEELLGSAQ